MNDQCCSTCQEILPADAFRSGKTECTWCQWDPMEKRAIARYKDKAGEDKRRTAGRRLMVDQSSFVSWYTSQPDLCYYCGTSRNEFKRIRARRSFGYFVSWDIDRKDSSRPYELGNLALSCFMCNMAKASYFSEAEARILGAAIRKIVEGRVSNLVQHRQGSAGDRVASEPSRG